MPGDQVAAGHALVAKLNDYEEASSSMLSAAAKKQPPVGLIILVTKDVAKLVEAAERVGE